MDTEIDTSELPGDEERIDIDALLAVCARRFQGFDPWAAGRARNMSDRQIRMGIGLLNGLSATEAARQAGWGSDGNVLRSAASKAARSEKMRRFIADAESFKAAPSNVPLTDQEKLKLLADIARDEPSKQIKIWAIKAHSQLQSEMNHAARIAEMDGDPLDTLDEFFQPDPDAPLMAAYLAFKYDLPWRPTPEQFQRIEADLMQLGKQLNQLPIRTENEGRASHA